MPQTLQPRFLGAGGAGSSIAAGSLSASEDRENVLVVDARGWDESEVRSLAGRFVPPRTRPIAPWLHAVAVVAPSIPDAVVADLAGSGVVLITVAPSEDAQDAVEGFLAEVSRMESTAAEGFANEASGPAGAGATGPGTGGGGGAARSPYSQTPAQFDAATYKAWLDRLGQPWRDEDAHDTDV